jgi:biotin transport system substrate-specific component
MKVRMNATLAQHFFPSRSLAKDATLVAAGTVLTAICSQIAIPWIPVPFTLQTFAVLLCGLVLGSRRGMLSQVAFITGGVAGLPFFTKFGSGMGHLTGLTGGYLIGFVLAAGLIGMLAERGWDRKVGLTALAMAIGTVVILACGFAWLSVLMGPTKALWAGVVPFLAGDVVKAAAVALVLPAAWRYVR